jgi:methyl-accepting chemotaxis protein
MSDRSNEGVIGAIRGRYAARLGLALLVAVALLLVLGLAVNAQTASQVREDARANLESSAAIQSDEVNEWVEGNQRQVRTASRLPALQSENHSEINAKLGDLVEREYVSDEVVATHVITDDEKRIIASSQPDEFVGENFAEMVDMDDPYVSKPFYVSAFDFPVVAMTARVPDENRILVFMINPTGEIEDLRQPVESGRTHVVTKDGNAVAAPNNASLSGPATDRAISNALAGDTGVVTREDGSLVGYAPVKSKDWVVLTHVERSEAFAMIDTVRTGVGGMVLVALLTLGIVGITVGRNTATALRSLAADARDLGEGDLDATFDVDRSDEIGTLARTLAETRDSLRARIDEVEQLNGHLETKAEEYRDVMRDAAAGDFTRRMDAQSENEAMAEIAEEFNEMIGEIERTTAEIKQFADQVAAASEVVTASSEEVYAASESVSESIQEISDGAADQDAQLQAVANEMSRLSATTEEIAASSNDVAKLAEETAQAGRSGRKAAREAMAGLDKIEATSDEAVEEIEDLEAEVAEIDELIDFVTEIATQTNMLALNASIEVSRSSAKGGNDDGFAAVANKIKELADEAKAATEDIEQRLERIKAQTEHTGEEVQTASDQIADHADSIQEAIDALETIAEHAQETNTGIQKISEATEQQADTTQEVVTMVDEVARISEETTSEAENVAAAAEEQTTALTEVSRSASDLTAQAERLEAALARFQTEANVDAGFGNVEQLPNEEPADDRVVIPASSEAESPDADSELDSDSDSKPDAGSGLETESVSESGVDTEAESDVDADADPETDSELDSETDADANSDADADPNSDTESEDDHGVESPDAQ